MSVSTCVVRVAWSQKRLFDSGLMKRRPSSVSKSSKRLKTDRRPKSRPKNDEELKTDELVSEPEQTIDTEDLIWMASLSEFWRFNDALETEMDLAVQETVVQMPLWSIYDQFTYRVPEQIATKNIKVISSILPSLADLEPTESEGSLGSGLSGILSRPDVPDQCLDSFVNYMDRSMFYETLIKRGLVDGSEEQVRYIKERYGDFDLCSNSCIQTQFNVDLLFEGLSKYLNIDFCELNFVNSDLVRRVVALHVVRHIIASQQQILYLAEEAKAAEAGKEVEAGSQRVFATSGWTRPRILICVPTKFFALEWVEALLALLGPSKVKNEERYVTELFSYDEDGKVDLDEHLGVHMLPTDGKPKKPLDYVETFRGNNDDGDCFIPIRIEKNSVSLYERNVYYADVIVCTTLGLRTLIGSKTEKMDTDYLSSIEMVVFDKAETMLMQNSDHLTRIISALNNNPRKIHKSLDIRRLRPCHHQEKEDLSQFLRQTIFLSTGRHLEIQNLLSNYSPNIRGCMRLWKKSPVYLAKEANDMLGNHVYFMGTPFDGVGQSGSSLVTRLYDTFMKHFVHSKFHQRFSEDPFLIVVPSYLEVLEVSNLLKQGTTTATFKRLTENTKMKKLVSIRRQFHEGQIPILIATERFLFFRRLKITGAKHLVFLGPPRNPGIFIDLLNGLGRSDHHTNILLMYWDPCVHMANMERIVGHAKVGLLTSKSRDLKLIGLNV
eukprot:Blabericola_migrator_1__3773@NODE_2131_length_3228_cov_41_277760_g1350_i0_p1_GENE_NODE_2131_length_3228_cov_41_277760_g1350_i0NODE_2131_length_3228_cov_41_277760_g1350_i0_p1_ORF_typecomplete_len720_score125_01UTP25/PF06862_12/5_7e102DEAD/PF00270_29/2_2e05DEAD/PF00270_29/6_5e03Helicase_C/PF00271_31/0_031_NODE_2131_length_3228_cov_41_277760_g1350_i06702829